MKYRLTAFAILLAVILAGCNFSLAEDITPPPDYQSPTPQPTLGPLYPSEAPSPARGAGIYLQECQSCHGDNGLGNGPMAQQMPVAVPAIGLRDISSQFSPSDWYAVISQGSLDRGMPPFMNLSPQQRWDVLAYVTMLSTTSAEVQRGAALYASQCASCHGTGGGGDGPQAASFSPAPTNFTNVQIMAKQSTSGLYRSIAEGVSPGMAAFGNRLSQDDIWALTAYLRSLTFDLSTPTATPSPATTSTPAGETSTPAITQVPLPGTTTPETGSFTVTSVPGLPSGTVSGKVASGSGAALPSGLTVTLRGFDPGPSGASPTEVVTFGEPLAADGAFQFGNVPMPPGRMFLSQVEYDGVPFQSGTVTSAKDVLALELPPVTLYRIHPGLDRGKC